MVRCGYLTVKRKTIVIGNIQSKKITPSLMGNPDELEHWSYPASIIYNLPNSEQCLSVHSDNKDNDMCYREKLEKQSGSRKAISFRSKTSDLVN